MFRKHASSKDNTILEDNQPRSSSLKPHNNQRENQGEQHIAKEETPLRWPSF
jgi:hypothetical protein